MSEEDKKEETIVEEATDHEPETDAEGDAEGETETSARVVAEDEPDSPTSAVADSARGDTADGLGTGTRGGATGGTPDARSRETSTVGESVATGPRSESELAYAEPRSKSTRSDSNFRLITTTITCASLILSGISMTIAVCAYQNRGTGYYVGTDGNSATFAEGSIAEIANRVSESVVSIVTETRAYSFWGQSQTSSAAGTGMVVTSDGYVLTNKHVVEGAENIAIVMDDGTTYTDVEIVGTDPANDVAFLKIKGVSDLKPVTLGNSTTITVGQQVIAIGNALGVYQNTVTEGIISGTGRSITASDSSYSSYETLFDMLQTDAAINAGNSGGPLINAAGEVIGINTAVSDANNIGFAIPISSIKGMLKNLTETGKVERAYLGVSNTTVTAQIAKEYDLSVNYGALIAEDGIVKNSPAEKAGLQSGDVILEVNGTKVSANASLSTLIGQYAVGDTVEIKYLRDDKASTVKVALEAYPSSTINSSSRR